MYSDQELELIFNNCLNLHEIGRAMEALLHVKADGGITPSQVDYVRKKAVGRMREV